MRMRNLPRSLWATNLIALLFPIFLKAQITFERTYGGTDIDCGYAVQQTADGGYIIAGVTSPVVGYNTGYLVKTDSLGDTLWTRTYAGINFDESSSVEQTADGGYVIAGGTVLYGAGAYDVYLIKTDSVGDTLWTHTYGGSGDEWGNSMQITPDSGYIIVGVTNSYGAGAYDFYLIETDADGDTLWTKTYGGSDSDIGHSVQNTPDGGYIITGCTWSYGAGAYDVYLIKTDSVGDTLWTHTYGGSGWEGGFSVDTAPDGGYITIGSTTSYGPGIEAVYLIRSDSLGDTLWTKTYGGSGIDAGFSVQNTPDGGYIITGFMSAYSSVYLIKIDSLGDTLWTRTYGGYCGFSVQQTADGGYVITGMKYSSSTGSDDVYLIKTDTLGYVGITESDRHSIFGAFYLGQCYPNPFRFSTSIRYILPNNSHVEIIIYDIQGQLVRTLVSEKKSAGTYTIYWHGKDDRGRRTSDGIYFYRMQAGNCTNTKKMILLR